MAPGSAHKPRKKKTAPVLARTPTITDIVQVEGKAKVIPEFPLVGFLWPARGTTSQWVLIPIILMIVGLYRWSVGLWGYSGFEKPPMHGDYEAQRHWMEITTHLPISQWYFYDLPYWGLDYPPLTAYHSWLCGKIGSIFDPLWFDFETSRGKEQQQLKVFMRATVIVSEYLIYVPALIIFLRHYSRNQRTGTTSACIALVAILMQPANILIDHGHFQYNTIMLGFLVASLSSIFAGRLLFACVFFVASLGFKQMALYYAPVIFAYLLGNCLTPRIRIGQFLAIAITTAVAFAALFAPILLGAVRDLQNNKHPSSAPKPPLLSTLGLEVDTKTARGVILLQLTQIIHRCFPFARGLFEDKVANFWCFFNTFYKLRNLQGIVELPRLSMFFTLMSILAPMMVIGAIPRKSLLPYALASSAWGFFLFSFQVHEKSVLLPLLPMTLLLGSKNGLSKEYRAWISFANLLGVWTMYPLLARDGLRTPYVVVSLLWAFLMGTPPTSVGCYYDPEDENQPGKPLKPDDLRTPTKIYHWQSIIVMGFWHLMNGYAPTPDGKPDLWTVINVCFGAFGFGICYLWCTWKLVSESGMLDDYFGYRASEERRQSTAVDQEKKRK